jgi:hypothetical protein
MKIRYTKWVYENPQTKKRIYYYVPIINLIIIGNHKVGKPISCYLDSGAALNIFPSEYATVFLGYSKKSLKKGTKTPILGVGGTRKTAYGHKCDIQHPEFRLKDIMIYFVEEQPYALLGRIGFMDQFERIVFDEKGKTLELFK